MTTHTYRILLGASLALLVGAAGAQNAPDNNSRMPAAKGAIKTMPAQPSEQPTDKMAADPNAARKVRQRRSAERHSRRPTQPCA